jgi:uncharacterized protein (UPF0147 family)
MAEEAKMDIKPVVDMIEQVASDRTVPKNIRAVAEEALTALEGDGDVKVRISTAIGFLDDVINDPNMPMYTRTQIWNIVSMLEQMRNDM